MKTLISGDTFPVLDIEIAPGEKLIAEPGELAWMSGSIRLQQSAKIAGAKNILGVLGRAFAGGGFFLTEYSADGAPGQISFAAKIPGAIMPVTVTAGQHFLIHRHGFLCGTPGIELSLGFQQSLGAGLFGGSGFIMQRLAGVGEAWVELGGQIITRDLSAGEVLQVHPGHVGMFSQSIRYDIRSVQGIRNMFFGGNGMWLARLTGPGRVWLQTLTLPNLAHVLAPYLAKENT